jgi:hypothetical protein
MIFAIGNVNGSIKIYHNESNFLDKASTNGGKARVGAAGGGGTGGHMFDDDDDDQSPHHVTSHYNK